MPVLIAPSILSADFADLQGELKRAEEGGADWIHVDVMDGHFVPNLTIGAPVVKAIRRATSLPLDVHLMITEPDRFIDDFAAAGASHLTVHVEACNHLQRTVSQIRAMGMLAGVALNPHTTPESLAWVLGDIDLVLIMTVNPGFGGQKFIPAVVPKIRAVSEMLAKAGRSEVRIAVDGGISTATAALAAAAGANVMVAGSNIYGAGDVKAAIGAVRRQAEAGLIAAAERGRHGG